MSMRVEQQQEQFSHAWLHAVAAVAGLRYTPGPQPDDDSVDAVLTARGLVGKLRSPSLHVQLKCEMRERRDPIKGYSVKIKNYDDLRYTDFHVPRILVVVVVPKNLTWWVRQKTEYLALRRCGYWASLHGLPVTAQDSVTVPIDRAKQAVTPESLRGIIDRIGNRQPLLP